MTMNSSVGLTVPGTDPRAGEVMRNTAKCGAAHAVLRRWALNT